MSGYYPQKGCAPERLTAIERITQNDPLVALAIEQSNTLGYLSAENRYIRGESQTYQNKLDETEDSLRRTKTELTYARNDVSHYQRENRTLETKVKRLTPKKPAKKVVKKAK